LRVAAVVRAFAAAEQTEDDKCHNGENAYYGRASHLKYL
jgi:hypothetical protein